MKCEDPEIISIWFKCVEEIYQAYNIVNKDTYNFNKTGFIIGMAVILKVFIALIL